MPKPCQAFLIFPSTGDKTTPFPPQEYSKPQQDEVPIPYVPRPKPMGDNPQVFPPPLELPTQPLEVLCPPVAPRFSTGPIVSGSALPRTCRRKLVDSWFPWACRLMSSTRSFQKRYHCGPPPSPFIFETKSPILLGETFFQGGENCPPPPSSLLGSRGELSSSRPRFPHQGGQNLHGDFAPQTASDYSRYRTSIVDPSPENRRQMVLSPLQLCVPPTLTSPQRRRGLTPCSPRFFFRTLFCLHAASDWEACFQPFGVAVLPKRPFTFPFGFPNRNW